jgi:hypothetical protein
MNNNDLEQIINYRENENFFEFVLKHPEIDKRTKNIINSIKKKSLNIFGTISKI